MQFSWLLFVLLCPLEFLNANFPTILPTEIVHIYNKSELEKLILKSDIFEKETENEIQLKNIKHIISGIQDINTSGLTILINNILKLLKDIVTQVANLGLPKLKTDFSTVPIKHDIKFPSLDVPLKFYNDLASTMSILHEKNKNYILTHQINKRNPSDVLKTFPSIGINDGLLSNPVGCKLRVKKSRNLISCISKYIDSLKRPHMTYIGSALLKHFIKILSRPVPLIRTYDIMQIIQKLDLVSEIATLVKRDKDLYNYEITVGSHLIEILHKRLSEGPTDQQFKIYQDLNIDHLLKNAGDEEITESEVPDYESPEPDPGLDEVVGENQLPTDVPPPQTLTPESLRPGGTSQDTPPQPLDPVTVSWTPSGNNIDATDEITTEEKITTENRLGSEEKVTKANQTEDNDPDITLNDTTSVSGTNTVDLNKMAESIAKINEKMLERIKDIDEKFSVHEKEAKTTLDKNEKFVSFQVKDETPLIIKNGLSNLMDYFMQLQDQLRDLKKALYKNSIQDLFSSMLTNQTYNIVEKGYNQEDKQIELIIQTFKDPIPMYRFEKVNFCGHHNCLTFAVDLFFSENMNYSPLFLEKDCIQVGVKEYSCINATDKIGHCLEFNLDCEFNVKPLMPNVNKLFLKKYLFVSTPLSQKINLNQHKILEEDTFNLITTSEVMSFNIDDQRYTVVGQNQPFKVVVNSIGPRSQIDKVIKMKLPTKWEISHNLINSLLIILTNVILGILVTVYCVRKRKTLQAKRVNPRTPKTDNVDKKRYFKVGTKLVYKDADTVDVELN